MNNYQAIMKKSSQNVLMALGNAHTIMSSKKIRSQNVML